MARFEAGKLKETPHLRRYLVGTSFVLVGVFIGYLLRSKDIVPIQSSISDSTASNQNDASNAGSKANESITIEANSQFTTEASNSGSEKNGRSRTVHISAEEALQFDHGGATATAERKKLELGSTLLDTVQNETDSKAAAIIAAAVGGRQMTLGANGGKLAGHLLIELQGTCELGDWDLIENERSMDSEMNISVSLEDLSNKTSLWTTSLDNILRSETTDIRFELPPASDPRVLGLFICTKLADTDLCQNASPEAPNRLHEIQTTQKMIMMQRRKVPESYIKSRIIMFKPVIVAGANLVPIDAAKFKATSAADLHNLVKGAFPAGANVPDEATLKAAKDISDLLLNLDLTLKADEYTLTFVIPKSDPIFCSEDEE